MKIEDVLASKGGGNIISVKPDVPMAEAIRIASEKNIGAIVVVDDGGQLVGIVTERDVLHQCHARIDFDRTPVADVMTPEPITISTDMDIHYAMDLMINKRFRHLPVVSKGKFEGIITIRDLIYAIRQADRHEADTFLDYLKSKVEE